MEKILELGLKVLEAMRRVLPNKKPEAVIGMEKGKEGWKVLVEVLERKAIPDSQDLLAIYEVTVSTEGNVLSYKQIRRRYRVSIEEEKE